MPDVTPTPPADDSTNAQSLFDRFPAIDTVEAYVSAAANIDDATKAAVKDVLEKDREATKSAIAVAIQAATPAGQAYPELVESGDGLLFLIDTATGQPRLDQVSIVHATDIPLPGAGPTPTPTPTPPPVNPPEPVPGPEPTPTPTPTPEPVPVNPPAGT